MFEDVESLEDELLDAVNGGAHLSIGRAVEGEGQVEDLVQHGQNSATLENLLFKNPPANGAQGSRGRRHSGNGSQSGGTMST